MGYPHTEISDNDFNETYTSAYDMLNNLNDFGELDTVEQQQQYHEFRQRVNYAMISQTLRDFTE